MSGEGSYVAEGEMPQTLDYSHGETLCIRTLLTDFHTCTHTHKHTQVADHADHPPQWPLPPTSHPAQGR